MTDEIPAHRHAVNARSATPQVIEDDVPAKPKRVRAAKPKAKKLPPPAAPVAVQTENPAT